MSAQVTEAHLLLAEQLIQDTKLSSIAQLIAESEAKACDQLRAEVERLRECCDQTSALCGKFITEEDGTDLIPNSARIANALARLEARAERAEAELAAERARLNWILRLCETGVFYRAESRAAIDAAMKRRTK